MKHNRFLMVIFASLALLFATSCSLWSTPHPSLKFDPETLPDAQVGVPYEIEIRITQNVTPVGDFSAPPDKLPPGLALIKSEEVKDMAQITGAPEKAGTYTFIVSVWCYGTNVSGQTGEKEYTIVVK